jgi:N-acetylglucosaminyldiphosphoundecaprenol N-acetyl-beta-D-mannosaminyltransferase
LLNTIEEKVTEEKKLENCFRVGRINVSMTSGPAVLTEIIESIRIGKPGYLCFLESKSAYIANHDPEYGDIQNRSLITFPDGMSIIWFARRAGYGRIGKMSGTDFMHMVFSMSAREGFSHYFFGSTPETIALLQENLASRYPGMLIHKAVSPPFQPVEAFDVDALAEELNRIRPTFFWCGLGAPKQERLMARLQPKLEATVCAGVGLAFEYIAGTVTRAPLWMQKSGFEGVFRILQQPQILSRVVKPFMWIFRELLLSRKSGT